MTNTKKGMNIQLFADPGDTLSLEQIEALVNDNAPATPPANADNQQQASSGTTPPAPEGDGKEGAKAWAARLRETSEKARLEALEQEAKADGFASYADKVKDRQAKTMKDQGLDPEAARPVFDKMYEERMATDPRIKELERLRAQEIEEFGKRQLQELSKELGREIKVEELDEKTLNLWKEKGDLTGAYMFYHGRTAFVGAVSAAKSAQSKGSTAHLANLQGGASGINDGMRPLTAAEKAAFKEINPLYTDEELSKKRIKDIKQ